MAISPSDVSGWWDFQEGTGTTSADLSGNSHIATLGATAGWGTGGPANLPNGVTLPGLLATSKIVVSNDFDQSTGCACFWYTTTSVADALLMGNGNAGGEFDVFMIGATTNLLSRTRYTTDRDISSSTTVTTATRYFVTYNFVSGGMQLFINASSVGTNTNTGTISDSGKNLVWGQDSDELGGDLLKGSIFQGILFNRVLTGTEITALYNGGSGQTYAQAFAPATTATYFPSLLTLKVG